MVKVAPALHRVGDFAAFLGEGFDEVLSYAALSSAESVGRPVGRRTGSPLWSNAPAWNSRRASVDASPKERKLGNIAPVTVIPRYISRKSALFEVAFSKLAPKLERAGCLQASMGQRAAAEPNRAAFRSN